MFTYGHVFLCLEIRWCFGEGRMHFRYSYLGVSSIFDRYFLGRNAELYWNFSKICCTDVVQLIYICIAILKFPKWADHPRSGGYESSCVWRDTEHTAVAQSWAKSSNSTQTKVSGRKKMWLRKCQHMVAINHWVLQSRDAKQQQKKGKLNVLQDVANEK